MAARSAPDLKTLWITTVCALAAAIAAPSAATTEEPAAPPEAVEKPPPGVDTPQGAVREFLEAARGGDWEEAALYLDLRRAFNAL